MIGERLAHYRIVGKLGHGGMGEVYRAEDTKLRREVAIKVLPEAFAKDADRVARFEREARLLASLNHPGIATLHGLEKDEGIHYLVMELVAGETLAERIARGPLPLEEALDVFRQIAEALEAAHEKAVIHRDLKPANIKITPEGKVKVLDFGLAKAYGEEEAPAAKLSESPTITRGTATGVILGTAPYMSPEQARGKSVDQRADIWAYGCCFFEALTGKPAFWEETVSDTMAAILKNEPDWQSLPASTPPALRRLLRRGLQKDPSRRLRDIGDARIELDEALSEPAAVQPVHQEPARRTTLVMVLGAVAAAALAVSIWSLMRESEPDERRVWRAVIPIPSGQELDLTGSWFSLAISPDARWIAYVARPAQSSSFSRTQLTQLYLRRMDQSEAQPVTGAAGAQLPFFSPDGQWLGYELGGKLMKVSIGGTSPGPPVTIADIGIGIVDRGVSWGPDGWIVYNRGFNLGLSRISADGGEAEVLTTPVREQGEKTHRLPHVLPGGKAALFTLGTGDILSYDEASIAALDLETREYHVVLRGGTQPRYSATGHLVYARDGSLWAAPFDLDGLEVKGTPVSVLGGVTSSPYQGAADFDVSHQGTLVFAPGGSWGDDARVVWVDREGRTQPLVDAPGAYMDVAISRDGRFLALYVEAANSTLRIYDIARGTLSRLTFEFDNNAPIWTPDGARVTFRTSRTGPLNLFWQTVSERGPAEQLAVSDFPQTAGSWSPDGQVLVFEETRPQTGDDLWVLDLEAGGDPEPLLQTPFNELQPRLSPDGRWIAYQSDESGQNEIYLARFRDAPGKWQVSTGGGTQPRWNPNGREIFYRNGAIMMAVEVQGSTKEPLLGKPRLLFERSRLLEAFDVAPDGERFVMIDESEAPQAPTHLNLVVNWGEELKRRAPAN